jgi:uncharacterized membrane protein YkgB
VPLLKCHFGKSQPAFGQSGHFKGLISIGCLHYHIIQNKNTKKMKTPVTLTNEQVSSTNPGKESQSNLAKIASWIRDRNFPFLIGSTGMIIMLIWGGAFKLTAPGAEGIVPLVSNSPLISWHFKLFGPYVGSDVIGLTEMAAALLILTGYFKPKAGIVGSLIATLMFTVTSTMFITTPGTVAAINGVGYMTILGLFLFKDILSLSVALYLVSYFGQKDTLIENKG